MSRNESTAGVFIFKAMPAARMPCRVLKTAPAAQAGGVALAALLSLVGILDARRRSG
jgi:hypothetical protein